VSAQAVRLLDARGLSIAAIELQQPSLDDVFLRLTGHAAGDEASDDQPAELEKSA
jgi:ABC-2 type transport system ATP-binding protein